MPPKRAALPTRARSDSGRCPQFFHIAPDGTREAYSREDCKLISAARMRGQPSVRVADVTLQDGTVLEFEVRFGSHAISRRMPEPPPSRLIQVNLASENTRVVVESMPEPELGRPPVLPAPELTQAAEPSPEPEEAALSIPLCYDNVTVELDGTESSDTFKVMVCEDQNRIMLQHTGEVQDHLFEQLEGAFRMAAFAHPEAKGGGIFGQGIASPFYLATELDFSERLSEPGHGRVPIKIIFGTRKAERDTMLVAIRGRPGLRDLPLIKQDDHFREGGLDGTWNEAFSSGDTVLCSSSDGTLLFTAGGSDAFRTWDAASTGQNLAVIETRVGRQYKTCMAVEPVQPDALHETVWLGESDGRISEVTVPTAPGTTQADGSTLPRQPLLQRQFTAHSCAISALMIDSRRMQLWTGSKNGELAVWNVAQLRQGTPCRKTKLGCPYFEPGKFKPISCGLEKLVAELPSTDPISFILSVGPGMLDQVWTGHGKSGIRVFDAGYHSFVSNTSAPSDSWSAATAVTCGLVVEAAGTRGGSDCGGAPHGQMVEHLSVWTGDVRGMLTQWEPSAGHGGGDAPPPKVLRTIKAKPGVAVTSILHCADEISSEGGSVLYAGFADGSMLAYEYSKFTSGSSSSFTPGPIRSISMAHHAAVQGMALFHAQIRADVGFPRFAGRGGALLKLATVGSNGTLRAWNATECITKTPDVKTRAPLGVGLYGGWPTEVYEGTVSKHAFGRRVSMGNVEMDSTPLKMEVVLHVYDLGTDNVGSSLLQKVNGHKLVGQVINSLHFMRCPESTVLRALPPPVVLRLSQGAFHTALEIGWPHADGSGWEYSYGYNDEDMTGVFSGLPKACDMHNYRESLSLGHTQISPAHVNKILAKMEEGWHGWDYHMLTRNCVNFTEQLCREVGMGEIPRWCGRAARAGAFMGLFQDESGYDADA